MLGHLLEETLKNPCQSRASHFDRGLCIEFEQSDLRSRRLASSRYQEIDTKELESVWRWLSERGCHGRATPVATHHEIHRVAHRRLEHLCQGLINLPVDPLDTIVI
jgi:hypothetical protein